MAEHQRPISQPECGPSEGALPLVCQLEALLFVAGEPVARARLQTALALDEAGLTALIGLLTQSLADRGIRLQEHDDSLQLVTAPECAAVIDAFLGRPIAQRLSHAALEALAIVSYRQPVTRAHIEAIRGVDSDAVLTTLLARGLIEEVGRLPTPGHPVQYGTTPEFLRLFGLASLSELPELASAAGLSLDEIWERRARPPTA